MYVTAQYDTGITEVMGSNPVPEEEASRYWGHSVF